MESPKGTTIQESNFVKVIPGYAISSSPTYNLDDIKVVPNPYIVNSDQYPEDEWKKKLRFTRLPAECTISIYTITGEKVRVLEKKNSTDANKWWDLRSYNNQEIAPGLYIYVVEAGSNKKIGKFAVIR